MSVSSPPVYAITQSPFEFGKETYQCIYLYKSTDYKYDAEGNAIRCGEMLLRLRTKNGRDIIQLASVKCSCSSLKGRCFEHLLGILIQEACNDTELFGKTVSLDTMIELFIFPDDIPEGVSFEDATKKLFKLYNKVGFNIESHDAPTYLIATLRDIDSNLNQKPYHSPGRTTSRSPHKTPRKTRSKSPRKSIRHNKVSMPLQLALSSINNISKSMKFLTPA
jgi:hypothetical protein